MKEQPELLVKTTLGCSAVVILIILPFTINNFIQDRVLMGLATLSVVLTCAINVWLGLTGRYSLKINTYLVSPLGFLSVVFAVLSLGVVGSYWPFLSALSFYFVLPVKRAGVANALLIIVVPPIAWHTMESSTVIRFTAALCGTSLFAFISMREINKLHTLLKKQAVTDTLTGLHNRTLLQQSLDHAINLNQRSGIPMALIMIDIDHFKDINDTYGHAKGDSVLRALGILLTRLTRKSDMVFRIGGEEFVILVYNSTEEMGVELAEKLWKEVHQLTLLPNQPVTISIGIAGLDTDMTEAKWMKSCDDKLYRAKANGRNQIVV